MENLHFFDLMLVVAHDGRDAVSVRRVRGVNTRRD